MRSPSVASASDDSMRYSVLPFDSTAIAVPLRPRSSTVGVDATKLASANCGGPPELGSVRSIMTNVPRALSMSASKSSGSVTTSSAAAWIASTTSPSVAGGKPEGKSASRSTAKTVPSLRSTWISLIPVPLVRTPSPLLSDARVVEPRPRSKSTVNVVPLMSWTWMSSAPSTIGMPRPLFSSYRRVFSDSGELKPNGVSSISKGKSSVTVGFRTST